MNAVGRAFAFALALAVIAAMGGMRPLRAATPPTPAARHHVQPCVPRVLTRLYFGSRMPDGTHVDERQWERFVENHVVPAAPEGFTVLRGQGGWRDASGMQRETTRIVEVVHVDRRAATQAWRAVAQAYAARFRQQSVLRTRQAVVACG